MSNNPNMVRRYNNISSSYHGQLYVRATDARNVYADAPKKAASQIIAAKVGSTVRSVYLKLRQRKLRNGESAYFFNA